MTPYIEETWEFLKKEALVVTRTALPVIISLYVKRVVDNLIGSKVIDEKIIKDGIKSTSPINTSATSATPQQSQFKEGPGSTYVSGHGRVEYRAHYRTVDKYDLYLHNDEMHPRQEGSCPMLFTDRGCHNCKFYVERPQYTWQSNCSAALWLEECRDAGIGLEHFRDQML